MARARESHAPSASASLKRSSGAITARRAGSNSASSPVKGEASLEPKKPFSMMKFSNFSESSGETSIKPERSTAITWTGSKPVSTAFNASMTSLAAGCERRLRFTSVKYGIP